MFNELMLQVCKDLIEVLLHVLYNSMSRLLKENKNSTITRSLIEYSRKSALSTHMTWMTWKFIEDSMRFNFLPISMLNNGTACKLCEVLCSFLNGALDSILIIGYIDRIFFTITSDNSS